MNLLILYTMKLNVVLILHATRNRYALSLFIPIKRGTLLSTEHTWNMVVNGRVLRRAAGL